MEEFKIRLSYESWDSIFNNNDNMDVDSLFNIFLNNYLRTVYTSFTLRKIIERGKSRQWITTGIKTSCNHKIQLYLLSKDSNDILDLFNDNFLSVAEKIMQSIRHSDTEDTSENKNPTYYLSKISHNHFPNIKFNNTLTKEIETIIKSIRVRNSHAYDGITTKMLKSPCSLHKLSFKLYL
jgi:hypothetical protein